MLLRVLGCIAWFMAMVVLAIVVLCVAYMTWWLWVFIFTEPS